MNIQCNIFYIITLYRNKYSLNAEEVVLKYMEIHFIHMIKIH